MQARHNSNASQTAAKEHMLGEIETRIGEHIDLEREPDNPQAQRETAFASGNVRRTNQILRWGLRSLV